MACTNLASVSTFYRLLRASGETRGQLTLHADRGTSMRSKPVALLLADLGVTRATADHASANA